MKKLNLLFLFFALGTIFMTSCKSSDSEEIAVIVEDGYYVTGTASPYSGLSPNALLANGSVEGAGYVVVERIGMFEGFVYLKAGVVAVTQKFGATTTAWGVEKVGKKTFDGTNDRINAVVDTAKLVSGGTTGITVTTEGLYHLVMDKTTNAVMLIPVKNWNLIGGPTSWSDTELTQKSLTKDGGEWEITNVKLKSDELKFRYDKGWKVPLNIDVNIFTNVSSATDATKLTLGAKNFPFAQGNGIFTVNLKWSPLKGYSATFTKTGEVPMTNFANCEIELVGGAIDIANVGAKADATSGWNWGNTLSAGKPTKAGNVYTWTWNSVILKAEGFKIRTIDAKTSGDVPGFDFGFAAVDAATSLGIVDDGGNIKASVAGNYKIVLTIDAANSDKKKVVITKL